MIFDLMWVDFENVLHDSKASATQDGLIHPLFYFEDMDLLHLYKQIQSITYHTQILMTSLENVNSFKLEFLRGAVELAKLPEHGTKVKLELVQ